MSRHELSRSWYSSGARSSAGNNEMCSGLFCNGELLDQKTQCMTYMLANYAYTRN
jgi:hypothetical protein